MQLTVYRGAGDRQGPNIIDELLTDVRAGAARGKQAINSSCSDRTIEQASCPLHSFTPTGSLAAVTETERRWSGMVRYYQLTLTLDADGNSFTADTALHIEREADE